MLSVASLAVPNGFPKGKNWYHFFHRFPSIRTKFWLLSRLIPHFLETILLTCSYQTDMNFVSSCYEPLVKVTWTLCKNRDLSTEKILIFLLLVKLIISNWRELLIKLTWTSCQVATNLLSKWHELRVKMTSNIN